MDFTDAPAQAALRAAARAWLAANAERRTSSSIDRAEDPTEIERGRDWQRRKHDAGWAGLTWPKEYGGRGLQAIDQVVWDQEAAAFDVPEETFVGSNMIAGPTIIDVGRPDQQAQHLPAILDGRSIWCQLFSEPDAGSDLTGLRTSAVRGDGGWVINGQKVWTSYAQFADWGICLARTDPAAPKSKGITFFVVDMRSPGVEVRPLVQLTGEAEFNEVFLSDVFVADDQLVGELNTGWTVANNTLSHERGTNPRQLVIHAQLIEELLRIAVANGTYDDPQVQQGLMEAFCEVRIFQLGNWRSLSKLATGKALGPEGSAMKLYWSEMSKRLHEVAMAVLGPAAPLWRGADGNPGDGTWQRSWLYYHGASIWAGTNEIQRTIVGERVLGLPRG